MIRIIMYSLLFALIAYSCLSWGIYSSPQVGNTLYNMTGVELEDSIRGWNTSFQTFIESILEKIESFVEDPAPNTSENIEGRMGK